MMQDKKLDANGVELCLAPAGVRRAGVRGWGPDGLGKGAQARGSEGAEGVYGDYAPSRDAEEVGRWARSSARLCMHTCPRCGPWQCGCAAARRMPTTSSRIRLSGRSGASMGWPRQQRAGLAPQRPTPSVHRSVPAAGAATGRVPARGARPAGPASGQTAHPGEHHRGQRTRGGRPSAGRPAPGL